MRTRTLTLFLLLQCCSAIAQQPDPSFNATGHRQLDPTGSDEGAESVVITPGGIFIAGTATPDDQNAVILTALNDDGSLQSSFGVSGTVTLAATDDIWYSPVVRSMPDGSFIVCANRSNDDGGDVVLWHVFVNGSVDATFGGGGQVVVDHVVSDSFFDLLVRPNGQLLLASFASPNALLTLFNANGSLAGPFGSNGVVTLPAGILVYVLRNGADDRIWLAGQHYTSEVDTWVARLNANGIMDPSFGNGGEAGTDLDSDAGLWSDAVLDMRTAPDGGSILLVNLFGDQAGYGGYRLARLTPAGTLDLAYGEEGVSELFSADIQVGHADLLMEPDGRCTVVGSIQSVLHLEKHLPSGALDQGWGNAGVASFTPPNMLQYFDHDAANDAQGRIVVVGRAVISGGTNDIVVDRFLNDWATGIRTASGLPRSQLYPNPTNGPLYLSVPDNAARTVEVQDVNGRTLVRTIWHGPGALDVSGLAPGSYVLRAIAGGSIMQERFVKQ